MRTRSLNRYLLLAVVLAAFVLAVAAPALARNESGLNVGPNDLKVGSRGNNWTRFTVDGQTGATAQTPTVVSGTANTCTFSSLTEGIGHKWVAQYLTNGTLFQIIVDDDAMDGAKIIDVLGGTAHDTTQWKLTEGGVVYQLGKLQIAAGATAVEAPAAAANTAGTALGVVAGAAGTGTTVGKAGGAASVTGGAGSLATGANASGAGGSATVAGGAGAASTGATGTGGAGGDVVVGSGAGGAANGGSAGADGSILFKIAGTTKAQISPAGVFSTVAGPDFGGPIILSQDESVDNDVNGVVRVTSTTFRHTGGSIDAPAGGADAAGTAMAVVAGAGGTATAGGQAGGASSVTGGAGSEGVGAVTSGDGGDTTVAGGAGAQASGATGTGGAGGDVVINSGAGGAANGGAAGAAGSILFKIGGTTYGQFSAAGVFDVTKTFASQTTENNSVTLGLNTDSTFIAGTNVTHSGGRGSAAANITSTYSGVNGGFHNLYSIVNLTGTQTDANAGVVAIKSVINNTVAQTAGNNTAIQGIAKHNHATLKAANAAPFIGVEGVANQSAAGQIGTAIAVSAAYHIPADAAVFDGGAVWRGIQVTCDNASGNNPSEQTGVVVWNMAGLQDYGLRFIKSASGFTTDIELQNGGTIDEYLDNTTNITNTTVQVTGAFRAAKVLTATDSTDTVAVATVQGYYGKRVHLTHADGVTVALNDPEAATEGDGVWVEFELNGDDNLAVTFAPETADTLIAGNNATADSVTFGSGHRIGAVVRFVSDGTKWHAINVNASCTMTVTDGA